jgi:hypothetical protein
MRRILLVAAILSTLAIAGSASAEQMRASRSQVNAERTGPVKKLVELERRKNEWLRQKFLNK